MKFNERTLALLQEYKYSNKPLEQVLLLLANSLGYDFCLSSLEGECATLLCNWKWGRLEITDLEAKLTEKEYFCNYQGMGY